MRSSVGWIHVRAEFIEFSCIEVRGFQCDEVVMFVSAVKGPIDKEWAYGLSRIVIRDAM